MVASQNGHTSVIEMLLAAGADPNHLAEVRKKFVTRVMLIHVPNGFVPNHRQSFSFSYDNSSNW